MLYTLPLYDAIMGRPSCGWLLLGCIPFYCRVIFHCVNIDKGIGLDLPMDIWVVFGFCFPITTNNEAFNPNQILLCAKDKR